MRKRGLLLLVFTLSFLAVTGFAQKDQVTGVQYAGAYMDVYAQESAASAKIGVLYPLQEVAVLGDIQNGRCKVMANGSEGYVEAANLIPYETARTILYQVTNGSYTLPVINNINRAATSDIIFVGDSRTTQMLEATQDGVYSWICEPTRGYDWFVNVAVPMIDEAAREGSRIVIQVGVNDLSGAAGYAQTINRKAAEWVEKGAMVYVVSVNPVDFHPTISDTAVVQFNASLQQSLLPQIPFLNTYQFLTESGYRTVDGVHYDAETYNRIYRYILCVLHPEQEAFQTAFAQGEAAWAQKWNAAKTDSGA